MSVEHIPFHLAYFDWHPGNNIRDEMEALHYSQKELADRLGLSPKVVCDLLKHKAKITPEYAELLSRVLGMTTEYWVKLENNWQASQERKKENEALIQYKRWPTIFKYDYLEELGVVPTRLNWADKVRELLKFFRFGKPECVEHALQCFSVCYRKRETKSGTVEARFTWLSVGKRLIECRRHLLSDYNKTKLCTMLKTLREQVTLGVDKVELQSKFESVGVGLVFVPNIQNNVIYGATYWCCGHPVIQMGCSYPSEDRFWFNLFHEVGHVLENNKNLTSVNTGESEDEEIEIKANIYASEVILPNKEFSPFLESFKTSSSLTIDMINDCAAQLNVPNSVIVGRLQHEGILSYSEFHALKKRVSFESDVNLIACD